MRQTGNSSLADWTSRDVRCHGNSYSNGDFHQTVEQSEVATTRIVRKKAGVQHGERGQRISRSPCVFTDDCGGCS
ncbi:hypothetical protein AOLI_G00207430 [Acnodon oligacanthus]